MRIGGIIRAVAAASLSLTIAIAAGDAAAAGIADIAVDPPHPSSSDEIAIAVSGVFPNSCVPRSPAASFGPGTVTVATTNSDATCAATPTAYAPAPVVIGTLSPGLYCVTVTYAHLGPAANLSQKCFTVADVSGIKGLASQVGKGAPPDQAGGAGINISGKFSIGATPLDLSASTVKLTGVVTEGTDELGEGINGASLVPVQLASRGLARPERATFKNAGTVRPTVRLQLRQLSSGLYSFNLKVSRATIPHGAAACATAATADLVTSFEINDASTGAVLQISTRSAWVCQGPTLRINGARGSGSGSSNRCEDPGSGTVADDPPRASLRTNLLSRDAGLPNLVELDGSGSTPGAGALVDYRFTVFAAGSCSVVFGPVHGAAAKVQTTLPTGEYVASVLVKDSLGAESVAAQRGFSTP